MWFKTDFYLDDGPYRKAVAKARIKAPAGPQKTASNAPYAAFPEGSSPDYKLK